jgi:hypothetical protein
MPPEESKLRKRLPLLTHLMAAGLFGLVLIKAGLWYKEPAAPAAGPHQPQAASFVPPVTLERAPAPASVNPAPAAPAEAEAVSSEAPENSENIPPLPERQPRKIR